MKPDSYVSPTYPLSGAHYRIQKEGQYPPAESDSVRISLEIWLPATTACGRGTILQSHLTFGARHKLFGRTMDDNVGKEHYVYVNGCSGDLRWRSVDATMKYAFSGTYAAQFEAADKAGFQEITKLEAALQCRADALAAAEVGDWTPSPQPLR